MSLSGSASITRTRGLERLYPDLQMFVESGTCVRRKTGEQKGVRFHVFIRSSLRREVLDRHSYSSGSAGLVGGQEGAPLALHFHWDQVIHSERKECSKMADMRGFRRALAERFLAMREFHLYLEARKKPRSYEMLMVSLFTISKVFLPLSYRLMVRSVHLF